MEQLSYTNNKKVETDSERYLHNASDDLQTRVTYQLLRKETQRLGEENISFKCYYSSSDSTLIAATIPLCEKEAKEMAQKLERLGYKPVPNEEVKQLGLKCDPCRRKYFCIKNSTLLKKHTSS